MTYFTGERNENVRVDLINSLGNYYCSKETDDITRAERRASKLLSQLVAKVGLNLVVGTDRVMAVAVTSNPADGVIPIGELEPKTELGLSVTLPRYSKQSLGQQALTIFAGNKESALYVSLPDIASTIAHGGELKIAKQ